MFCHFCTLYSNVICLSDLIVNEDAAKSHTVPVNKVIIYFSDLLFIFYILCFTFILNLFFYIVLIVIRDEYPLSSAGSTYLKQLKHTHSKM